MIRQSSYMGVAYLKVLRISQRQMEWERNRGFQKYFCDLSLLITLLSTVDEAI